jgi:four helix bundle protein
MRYQRFEELPVWNDAIDLAHRLISLTQSGVCHGIGDLKTQLERASISISNNIAEGFERGTNDELISFLYYARGSSGEVRSMLRLLRMFLHQADLSQEIDDLIHRAENISKQLGGWIESLKNSGFKGTRSQNAQTRAAARSAKRRDEFLAKLRALQAEASWILRPSRDEDPSADESPPRGRESPGA